MLHSYSSGKVRKLPLEPRTVRYSYRVFIKSTIASYCSRRYFFFFSFFSPSSFAFPGVSERQVVLKFFSHLLFWMVRKEALQLLRVMTRPQNMMVPYSPIQTKRGIKKRNKKVVAIDVCGQQIYHELFCQITCIPLSILFLSFFLFNFFFTFFFVPFISFLLL